ncbi:MAG: hypothetical protein ACXAB7_20145 [Candidatus Kariarchaeaceae archaeon]
MSGRDIPMSYQAKVPGTKFVIELAQFKEQWFIQLIIEDSIEEETQLPRLSNSLMEEKINEVTRNAGFPLNPLQLKNIIDEINAQTDNLIVDDVATKNVLEEQYSDWHSPDWHSPTSSAAIVEMKTPTEPRREVVQAQPPPQTYTQPVTPTAASSSRDEIQIDQLRPIFLKLRKAVSLLDASVEELENLLSK